MKKNIIISGIITLVLIVGAFFVSNYQSAALGAVNLANSGPLFYKATSTAFTLTTTSQRLLGTSTPTHRVAAAIQVTNCSAGSAAHISMNQDAPAVANTGFMILASSTQEFRDYPNLPVVQGSVTGIVGAGTCTVLVTEWRLAQ